MTELQTDHKVFLGSTRNSKSVWYDSVSSHAATHIKDTPNLDALALEVIKNSELTDSYTQFHTDLGRVVGMSDLVKTDDVMKSFTLNGTIGILIPYSTSRNDLNRLP